MKPFLCNIPKSEINDLLKEKDKIYHANAAIAKATDKDYHVG